MLSSEKRTHYIDRLVNVFSGHSLRSGFATTAAIKGKTLPKIMRQGRWKDQRTAMMYIRPATVWEDNASDGLGDLVEKKR